MAIPGSKLTFEDLYCEDVASPGGVLRPHPMTLMDLVGVASKIQQTEGDAPKTLPYPGEFILEELADVYIDAGKLHARLKEMQSNALITSNPKATATLEDVIVSLMSIKKICKVIGEKLDSLSIDKLTPPD